MTTTTRAGTFSAFSSRDFRLLWGGQTISFVGDAAFIVALGWRVTDLTGKASSLGFVLALESLAMLVTLLWGGVLADRHSRRLLMIGSDVARAGVLAAFLGFDATGNLSLRVILVLVTLFGLADGFFQPAFSGIVPLVVEQPMLPSASSWMGVARNGSAIVGPGIAAGLYHTSGPALVWGIDAASFLCSATALWLARPRRFEPARQQGVRRELLEGLSYVLSVPWIWTGIAAATVILMVAMAPFTALLPRVVQVHYDRGVGAYGAIFSAMAVGMVAGSLAWAKWHPGRRRVLVCFAAFGINDLGIIVLALSSPSFSGSLGRGMPPVQRTALVADVRPGLLLLRRLLNIAFVLCALAVSALVLRHFLHAGWPLHRANAWLVGLAALVMLGAYAAKAWGWQHLFRDEQRPAVLTLAAAGGAASVGGIALPGRCDEVIRVAVVRRCRRRRASIGAVALSLFVLGLLDSAALTPLASLALGISNVGGWLRVGLAVVAVAGVLAAAAVLFLPRRE